MTLTITHAGCSDSGRTHQYNQDRWLAEEELGLYIVADGMAQDRPSQKVVDRLPALLRRHLPPADRSASVADAVCAALVDLNDEVRAPEITGSTVVLALVRGGRALIAHLGDSRAYLVRDRRLERLTRDHSVVQRMVDTGVLTPEEAADARSNGGPTQFVGMWGDPEPDVRVVELAVGDRILLCSDGLPEMLRDDDLLAVLNRWPDPAEACGRLIAAANAAGGRDNLTAVIIAADAPPDPGSGSR